MTALAVIGAGVMGETLIAGLIRAGWEPSQITAADRHAARLGEISTRHGIHSSGRGEPG